MAVAVPLMVEYEAVLNRSEQLTASGLNVSQVTAILDAVCAIATAVNLRFLWRPRLRDPADEMVLETAANSGANRLVSFNVRDFESAAKVFGIRVVTPPEMWRKIHAKK
jgi:predicted nucleic acid-binding protein